MYPPLRDIEERYARYDKEYMEAEAAAGENGEKGSEKGKGKGKAKPKTMRIRSATPVHLQVYDGAFRCESTFICKSLIFDINVDCRHRARPPCPATRRRAGASTRWSPIWTRRF